MRPFAGRRVLLGVTGGIASYKTTWLARLLHKAGAEVDVVLSRSAREFVGAVTFEALTGRPVHTELIASGHALDHIKLARDAHAIVVAPVTADFLARAAHGNADDLLSAVLLAAEAPVLFVPAMNDKMWAHKQTQANVERCCEIGYNVLPPDTGDLAAGEGAGPGRMPEPETIFAHVGRMLEKQSLAGRRVVVTAGPTREPLDPVRFLSNRSSGKMGVAIAASAWRRGATVALLHGPLEVALPVGPRQVPAETTAQLRDAVADELPNADALIMAAAPADFSPVDVADSKIKKSNAPDSLALAQTPDILADTRKLRRNGSVIVGFALETENAVENARAKIASKALDAIVVNNAREPGAGFGVDTNRVTLVFADGKTEPLPLMSKDDVADQLLDRVEAMLNGR
ncbi:MAG TPA: bifunctional phosphopantothenoylcysteine decarboxylase/phosphopantothenate--cysteine ligase CoaBC [Gemmatimonadaceae bacterium]|nr:bifunctional phosphopantothenoylcysteine decarboxylase/phosphopantothenate--cysteine ligase CoaBC [Gemmatimonadaceae bacterium]